MLAATAVPDRVQSLVLIEPGCYQAARDHPVVAEALRRNRATVAQIPQQISDAQYLQQGTTAIGMTPLEPTPERLRAARGGRHERPCWEAPIPVEALAAATFPKMVISGTWENAPAAYRRLGGEPLMACAALTAQRIGARLIKIKGASHFPHVTNRRAT
jgi:pimeloyl-ACP methyl ester carboxylesterase